ncbi:exonuclease RecJ [Halorussus gelatinilyticus]|uniref:Exonuclease RecJ n=1 Tax=Halorussus gelatinilyticus TaxID=2937524 RepID=A0A8U0IG29_9EURY|nr:exonuclease RecJ [Halorussus gelatinilyticus]UPV99650.1 exonuclease RecJ [Halorussus gelatinilyticus]
MSTSGRSGTDGAAPSASDVAAGLREADFVRVLARADGDCLAAAGLLARACADRATPYQVRVGRFGETLAGPDDADSTDRDDATDADDTTVAIGLDPAADVHLPAAETPASVTAYDAAGELGATPDAVLALAGVVATGRPASTGESAHVLERAREAGVARRPGVGVPTDDLVDGLAHSTLAHADYSGDGEAVQAALAELGLPAELDEAAHRAVASEFALAVTGAETATDRAAEAVERALRPHAIPSAGSGDSSGDEPGNESDGASASGEVLPDALAPFATVEGYADVLEAVARERPGAGVALALGHDARADALDAWRDHGERAHAVLREATTGRYDGLFALRTDDAPVETVARLLRDFRSPEPVALVVGESEAAATAVEDSAVGAAMTEAAQSVGGTGGGTLSRGYARFDPETDAKEFLAAFREARP